MSSTYTKDGRVFPGSDIREWAEDLLAALQAIHDCAKGPLPWSAPETRRNRAQIEAWARAAIAKATGRDAKP